MMVAECRDVCGPRAGLTSAAAALLSCTRQFDPKALPPRSRLSAALSPQ